MNVTRRDYELLHAEDINGKVYPIGALLNLPADFGDGLCNQGKAKVTTGGRATVPRRPVRKRCCGW